MIREIVLDTNVLVAAWRSKRGASYELIRSIGTADWRLNISVALALEYEDILKRTDISAASPRRQSMISSTTCSAFPTWFHLSFADVRVCGTRMMSVF